MSGRVALPGLAALALAVLLPGCGYSPWRECRDDPYLDELARRGIEAAQREANGVSPGRRLAALRVLARQAGDAQRRNRPEEASRLAGIVVRRYQIEKDASVRAGIVAICAPSAGAGNAVVIAFLRERLAAGEFPGPAALSLAALAPPGAFGDIEPLTRHPDPETRLRAAEALCALGDPRGFEAVARVWRGMSNPPWPAEMSGVGLPAARGALAARAERIFARPLF